MSFNDARDIDAIPFIAKEARTNIAQKKSWEKDQGNEHTRINKYKEGVCYGCFNKDTVYARMLDVCADCRRKRGIETIMSVLTNKMYGYCPVCAKYKFDIAHINVRMCAKCNAKVAKNTHAFNKAGGHVAVDPFWQRMRRKFGKDYKELYMLPWIKRTL